MLVRGWTRLIKNVHKIRKAPFAKFLRRILKDDRVIVYWHAGSRNWLMGVAHKRHHEKGLWEVKCLNHDPEGKNPKLTHENIRDIKDMWFNPGNPREMMARVKSEQSDRTARVHEENEEMIRKRQFIGRSLNPVRASHPFFMTGLKYTRRR